MCSVIVIIVWWSYFILNDSTKTCIYIIIIIYVCNAFLARQRRIGIFHVIHRYHVMLLENSLKSGTVGP